MLRKISRALGFLTLSTGLFLLPVIFAAETNDTPRPEFGGQWIWAFFSLVLVAFLAYWGSRFLAGKLNVTQAKHLKVAESLCLGPNRHLYLLLVNNQVLLLGSSEQGITCIKEYNDDTFYEILNLTRNPGQALPSDNFRNILMNLFKPEDTTTTETTDFNTGKRKLIEGLNRIREWRKRRR